MHGQRVVRDVLLDQLQTRLFLRGFGQLGEPGQQMRADLQILHRSRGMDVIQAGTQLGHRVEFLVGIEAHALLVTVPRRQPNLTLQYEQAELFRVADTNQFVSFLRIANLQLARERTQLFVGEHRQRSQPAQGADIG